MAKQMVVVSPVLTPDWLEKRRGIVAEIDRQLIVGVQEDGKGLTLEQLQLVTEHRNPFEAVESLKTEVIQAVRPVDKLLADWTTFYREIGVEVDFSELKLPARREGFDRLIVVAKGMSPERVYQKCREHFQCWKYAGQQSLDEVVFDTGGVKQKYRRSDHETHAMLVRDRVEADEELKNRSANDIAAAKIPGITLEARELYEFKYFKEIGKHLDRRNWTLCTGSRNVDSRVPGVRWSGDYGRLSVDWYDPDNASVHLRSREQVS